MRSISAVVLAAAACLQAQTRIDLRTQAKSVDFSAADSTKPAKTGTTLPATCAVGELFFKTDAPAGNNLYGCTATNTWTLQREVLPSTGGDISGTLDAVTVQKIQGRGVAGSAPASGQVLKWNATAGQWEPGTVEAGVSSVMGRTGAVTAQTGDYTAAQVTNAADKTAANSFSAGAKQTFAPNGTTSGLRIVPGGLPTAPQAGDVAIDAADGNRLKTFDGTQWTAVVYAAPYQGTFSNATTVTVTAAVHGQGSRPTVQCFDNATPANWMMCAYTVAANGDVTIRFSPAQSGSFVVSGAPAAAAGSGGGGGGGAVSSVFGRTGAVTAMAGDYATADIAGLQSALDGKAAVEADYTIAMIPDPQMLALGGAGTTALQTMMQWLVDNAAAQNIKAVVGVGDIVNTAGATEYTNAWTGWSKVDAAGIPWITPPGNHDYPNQADPSSRVTDAAFTTGNWSPLHFAGKPWYGASNYPAGSGANSYALVNAGARKLLILALEFFPRDAAVAWAQNVINQYPDREVIVTTHAYLTEQGLKASDGVTDGPITYHVGGAASNNGQELWDKLIKVNRNITMVVGGHFIASTGPHVRVLSEAGTQGNTVHQIYANFQDRDQVGPDKAYMLLVKFRPSAGVVEVRTYRHVPAFTEDSSHPMISLAYAPAPGGGEVNTALNAGTAGVGLFDNKSGAELQFRTLNAASGRVSVALDAANKKIDVDVAEGALSLGNLSGAIALSQVAAAAKQGNGGKIPLAGGSAPADQQVLKWNAATGQWEPGTDVGGGGANAVQIQGRDVAGTAPADGQALVWNATAARWEPRTGTGANATQVQGRNVAATAPADGQAMRWNAAGSQWEPQAEVRTWGVTIDGGGGAITTGHKGYAAIPYGCTVARWDLIADQAGSIAIEIDKRAGAAPAVGTDSMVGTGTPPRLASQQVASGTDFSGYASTVVAANDIVGFNVTAASTVTRATLVVSCLR